MRRLRVGCLGYQDRIPAEEPADFVENQSVDMQPDKAAQKATRIRRLYHHVAVRFHNPAIVAVSAYSQRLLEFGAAVDAKDF
jgi:hypothetical protein